MTSLAVFKTTIQSARHRLRLWEKSKWYPALPIVFAVLCNAVVWVVALVVLTRGHSRTSGTMQASGGTEQASGGGGSVEEGEGVGHAGQTAFLLEEVYVFQPCIGEHHWPLDADNF